MIKKITVSIIFTLGLIIMFSSCMHDRNHPGYAYMPDMYYSEAFNAYSPNTVFTDGLTMRTPADGTIPRGYKPYPYQGKNYFDQIAAGQDLINPVIPDAKNLAIGKEYYSIFCSSCHGVLGKGDGHLYTSKKFPVKPTSLVEAYVQGKADGEIFHIITRGSLSGLMGAHGSQIPEEKRWMIINYVRTLAK